MSKNYIHFKNGSTINILDNVKSDKFVKTIDIYTTNTQDINLAYYSDEFGSHLFITRVKSLKNNFGVVIKKQRSLVIHLRNEEADEMYEFLVGEPPEIEKQI